MAPGFNLSNVMRMGILVSELAHLGDCGLIRDSFAAAEEQVPGQPADVILTSLEPLNQVTAGIANSLDLLALDAEHVCHDRIRAILREHVVRHHGLSLAVAM